MELLFQIKYLLYFNKECSLTFFLNQKYYLKMILHLNFMQGMQ